jgi:hypothetical protein
MQLRNISSFFNALVDDLFGLRTKACATVRKYSADTADLGLTLPVTYATLLVCVPILQCGWLRHYATTRVAPGSIPGNFQATFPSVRIQYYSSPLNL